MKFALSKPYCFIHISLVLLTSLLLSACSHHKVLVPNGLKFIQVGDPMVPPATYKLKGQFVRDTLFSEGEYHWRGVVLDYPDGKVYIEGDFYGSETVNRIRVQTPQFQFRKEIFVGMSIAELQALPWQWEVYYLESFGMWDLSSPSFPGLHLLISAAPSPLSHPAQLQMVEELPNTCKVQALVFL